MGSTYTRQSSTEIVDGEVINAADFNNEFAQLVTAFTASTGHSHDGTTAEGGNPLTRQSVEGSGFAVALKLNEDAGSSPFVLNGFQLEFTAGGRH